MKPEDIQFMFGELVQRSEQLFFSTNETSDGRLFQLPTFLLALASIVKEIDEVCMESFPLCWHADLKCTNLNLELCDVLNWEM